MRGVAKGGGNMRDSKEERSGAIGAAIYRRSRGGRGEAKINDNYSGVRSTGKNVPDGGVGLLAFLDRDRAKLARAAQRRADVAQLVAVDFWAV